MVVCKFFLQGECKFGESCRFDHQFPSGNITGNQQPFPNNQNRNQIFATKPANEVDTNTLITSVHNDMISIEKSGQWLLTCYAPFKEKPLFPGFQDQSFEEIRLGFYEAQKTNTFEQYKQQLHQALVDARIKFKALQTPTKEMVEILRNIYNAQLAPPATNSSANVSSVFGNKSAYGLPTNNIFGQNASMQNGNQNSGSLFGPNAGQNSSAQLFGQQNVKQNSAGIFGQQSKTSIFGQQSANNGMFTQNTNPQNSNSIFANANKNLFGATNSNQNAKDLFNNSPQQLNSLQQTNQNIFSGAQQNQSQNMFTTNNQNHQFGSSSNGMIGQMPPSQPLFGQIDADKNQPHQNKPDFIQGSANSKYLNPQSNPIFTNQNHQTSSISFSQNANSVFNNAQPLPGYVFSRLGQQESSKSIFGNSNQNIPGNSPLSGNIFNGCNNAPNINHDAYSKIDELSEDDIKWFKSNDLDIATIPDKPPTYEMCFT